MVQIQNSKNTASNKNLWYNTKMVIALPTTFLFAFWALRNWLPFSSMRKSTTAQTVIPLKAKLPECEGYWPETEICLELGKHPSSQMLTEENAGCPQWKISLKSSPWTNQQEVSSQLREIESLAKEWERLLGEITSAQLERCGGEQGVKPPVWIARQRGMAWSRIEEGVMAGNSEYHTDSGECWTDALLPLYMDEYNIEPSDHFKTFVMSFDVQAFRTSLAQLKTRMGPP